MSYRIVRVDATVRAVREIIAELDKHCFPADGPCDVKRGWWWLVYDDREEPVAYAGMRRSYLWSDAGYTCRVGVLERHRGQGLQLRLLRVRQRYARSLGWNWLISDTWHNPSSANNLIKAGFVTYEPRKPWGEKGTIYWKCRL